MEYMGTTGLRTAHKLAAACTWHIQENKMLYVFMAHSLPVNVSNLQRQFPLLKQIHVYWLATLAKGTGD